MKSNCEQHAQVLVFQIDFAAAHSLPPLVSRFPSFLALSEIKPLVSSSVLGVSNSKPSHASRRFPTGTRTAVLLAPLVRKQMYLFVLLMVCVLEIMPGMNLSSLAYWTTRGPFVATVPSNTCSTSYVTATQALAYSVLRLQLADHD
jgi:hypothetical protein